MASVMVTLFFLLLLPFVVCSQSNGTRIATDSSLVAGNPAVQSWRSPSDDFAFGFQNVGSDLFLLSIWFYKVPENNIVWFAKADGNPILVPRGSKIELTASKGLVLLNPQGGELWKSVPITPSVAFATLSDTGNLVLGDTMNGSIWETFRYPTDTLLPTQKLEKNGALSSLKSPGNFSLGRFQFRLLEDGNAVLNTMNLPSGFPYDAYYISGTYDPANSQNSGNQVILDEHGFLYVLKGNGAKFNITKPRVGNPEAYYFRATMNFDGVLTVSSYPKGPGISSSERWKDWSILPENICVSIYHEEMFGSGTCGYNSLCTLKSNGRPSCNCPQGYSLIDPSDEYGDCKPDVTLECEEEGAHNHMLYQMVELSNTNWPMHDYERISDSNEQDCRSSCLEDCFCVVADFGAGSCWKKRLPLSNGRQDRSIPTVSFLKLRKDDVEVPRVQKKQATIVVVMAALLGGSVFLIFLLLGSKCLGLGFFALKKEMIQSETRRKSFSLECNLIQFAHKDLFKATGGFKEELGRGSCGIVYKGTTEAVHVAVKKLDRMFEAHREREFRTEVSVIGQTHHKNLVRLLGYCDEGNNRMLVYQFMSNGSLSSFLFNGGPKPSWKLRAQIAYEIARGLLYLHEECNTHIIHCDIKPQNILLDDDYSAKISDFGLAKMLKMDQSRTETGIRGTKGYVAPEWFRSSPVNAKVDVYSYGVLLLEIVCCRRNVEMEAGDDVQEREGYVLTDWAYDCYEQGRLDILIKGDVEAMDDFLKVERFVKVAIWCLQEDTSRRPTMKDVMLMLEGNAHVSSPPCPSPFTSIV